MREAHGLNIFGHFFGISGWAQHARYFSLALCHLRDLRLTPWDSSEEHPGRADEPEVPACLWAAPRPEDASLAMEPVDTIDRIIGRYRIAYPLWETTRLPERKRRCLHLADELWVPSEWGRTILLENGFQPDRVRVVPAGVETAVFRPRPEAAGEASRREFRFLCMGKWEIRKGVSELIRAYAAEFGPHEPVELVLHCFNPYTPRFSMEGELKGMALGRHPRIRLSHPTSREELVDLYNSCDVFVLPTRGEGWGLPIIEAMSCGVPVITTDYSAPKDYVNDGNGYLIGVERLVPVRDSFFYGDTEDLGVWAQPDLQHLRELMRSAYSDRDELRRKGLQARRDACRSWTWARSAEIADRRLSGL